MLERIDDAPYAEFVLVVLDAEVSNSGTPEPRRSKPFSRIANLWKARQELLYSLHQRMDRRRSIEGPDAFEEKGVSELLHGVPALAVSPRRTKFSDYIPGEDLEHIQGYELDVIIRLDFRILRGGILDVAKAGVWSFHHGDNRVNRGGPAGYWEVMLEWTDTGSVLQILNEDLDNGFVLDRSWASTNPVSVRANQGAGPAL